MKIKLPEIQAALDTLKNDSPAMANPQVRTAVEQLDEMLSEFELEGALAAPDDTLDLQPNISALEQLTSLIPQILGAVCQKEPLLMCLIRVAIMYRGVGEPERAIHLCEQIMELTADGESPYIRAEAFRQLGNLQFYQGQWSQAQTYYQQSLALFEANNDRGYVASIYNSLGYIAVQQGNYDLANKHHQRVIDIVQPNGDSQRILAGAYNSLGIIASVQADWNAAIDSFEKSLTIYDEIQLPREAAGVYMNLAMAYVDIEEWVAAGEYYAQATALAEKSGNLLTLSKIYINRAEFLLNIGTIDVAQLYCDKALVLFQKINDNIGIAEVYKLYGRIHRHRKDWDAAVETFAQSLQHYQSCQNPQGEAEGCYEFGLMYKDCQNPSQAHYFLKRSRLLYEYLGATHEMKRVDAALATLAA